MFWYHEEVKALELKPVLPKGEKPGLIFYGSSSLRLWPDIGHDFPGFEVVNQAFGGSTLAACSWFFKRLVPRHQPDLMVFYAGDNDLGDGRHPEEVFFFFCGLMEQIHEYCGDIPVGFISVKPSFSRTNLLNSIRYTNQIIREEVETRYANCKFINVFDEMLAINSGSRMLFEEDGLHLSPEGYRLWKSIIKVQFLDPFLAQNNLLKLL
jgi:lysophospholipase L1-like esterase